MPICFAAGSLDPALLAQLSRALEKRTELASRRAMPGLWKRTDALRQKHPKQAQEPRPAGHARFWLVVGILVTGFCLFEPQKLMVLLAVFNRRVRVLVPAQLQSGTLEELRTLLQRQGGGVGLRGRRAERGRNNLKAEMIEQQKDLSGNTPWP